jgi:hypothetical protein
MKTTKRFAKLAAFILAGAFAVACGGSAANNGGTTPKPGGDGSMGGAKYTAPTTGNGNPCSM